MLPSFVRTRLPAVRAIAYRAAVGSMVCGVAALAAAASPAAGKLPSPLQVQAAAMRLPAPGFDSSVITMTVTAPAGARIVGASLPGAARAVRLHAMPRVGDVVEMTPVAAIDLPPGVPVSLRTGSGSFHLMAIGLRPSLGSGGQEPRLQLDVVVPGRHRPQAVSVPLRLLPPRGAHVHSQGADDH